MLGFRRMRIGKAVGNRVGVLNPIQFALAQDRVRVGIELQEGSNLRDALLDVTPDLKPALGPEVGGEQDVDVGLRPGEQEPLAEAVDGNSAVSAVATVNVLSALGVIEFL